MEFIIYVVLRIPAVRTFLLMIGPSLLLLYKVYRRDSVEAEPVDLIVKLAILGGTASVAASLALGRLGDALMISLDENGAAYLIINNFIVIALVEELAKYLPMRLVTWKNPNFNCTFDGIVYCAAAAAGFSLIENIMYVVIYGSGVTLMRALLSVPSHICFGIVMGIWYSAAKKRHLAGDLKGAFRCRIAAVALPALMHGSYDLLASASNGEWILLLIAFVIVQYIVCARLIGKSSNEDDYFDVSKAVGTVCPLCQSPNYGDVRFCAGCFAVMPAFRKETFEAMRAYHSEHGHPETVQSLEDFLARVQFPFDLTGDSIGRKSGKAGSLSLTVKDGVYDVVTTMDKSTSMTRYRGANEKAAVQCFLTHALTQTALLPLWQAALAGNDCPDLPAPKEVEPVVQIRL